MSILVLSSCTQLPYMFKKILLVSGTLKFCLLYVINFVSFISDKIEFGLLPFFKMYDIFLYLIF